MFRVGQKVVCVDASGRAAGYVSDGKIYTVRALSFGYDCSDGLPGIHLCGVSGGQRPFGRGEAGFHPRRFRPLTEKKADMEARRALFREWEGTKPAKLPAWADQYISDDTCGNG
jgi:hypothetical protein